MTNNLDDVVLESAYSAFPAFAPRDFLIQQWARAQLVKNETSGREDEWLQR